MNGRRMDELNLVGTKRTAEQTEQEQGLWPEVMVTLLALSLSLPL